MGWLHFPCRLCVALNPKSKLPYPKSITIYSNHRASVGRITRAGHKWQFLSGRLPYGFAKISSIFLRIFSSGWGSDMGPTKSRT